MCWGYGTSLYRANTQYIGSILLGRDDMRSPLFGKTQVMTDTFNFAGG